VIFDEEKLLKDLMYTSNRTGVEKDIPWLESITNALSKKFPSWDLKNLSWNKAPRVWR
jgi:hypothetical protein